MIAHLMNNIRPIAEQGMTVPPGYLPGVSPSYNTIMRSQPSSNNMIQEEQNPFQRVGQQVNWDHVLNSQIATSVGSFLGENNSNSYTNAILDFNKKQFNPMNYLPENSNVSQQALYGMALGGLFDDGGGVEQGPKKPIITNNPNDPRLKAYSDSSTLYNQGERAKLVYEQYVNEHNTTNPKLNRFALHQPANSTTIKPIKTSYIVGEGNLKGSLGDPNYQLTQNMYKKNHVYNDLNLPLNTFNPDNGKYNSIVGVDQSLQPLREYKQPVQPIQYQAAPQKPAIPQEVVPPWQRLPDGETIKTPLLHTRVTNMIPKNVKEDDAQPLNLQPLTEGNWSATQGRGEGTQQTRNFNSKASLDAFVEAMKSQGNNPISTSTNGNKEGSALFHRFESGGSIDPAEDIAKFIMGDDEPQEKKFKPKVKGRKKEEENTVTEEDVLNYLNTLQRNRYLDSSLSQSIIGAYKKGGIVEGQTLEVSNEEVERLKKLGYKIEIL